jgi:acetyl-CoA decarbonylase/synthase, CODH/ACS complex subunit delta
MSFTPTKETYSGKVYPVTIGADPGAIVCGGENSLPFHAFEGTVPNRPVIAYEVQDMIPDDWPEEVLKPYADVVNNPVAWAQFCRDTFGARVIALRLAGTHPDRADHSAEEAARTVREVLSSVDTPCIILGSNHAEKDASVLVAAAEAAKDRNCIIGKAQESNYKTIAAAAMANNHKLVAMSELDINLSKQLNILITQLGFEKERIIIDPMCSALGYGIEYTYSVIERIRLAALAQNDPTVQQPILGDVGMYVWKVKETQAGETDVPQWGSLKERSIAWESVTALSLLLAGTEILIMRHPEAIQAVEKVIEELL